MFKFKTEIECSYTFNFNKKIYTYRYRQNVKLNLRNIFKNENVLKMSQPTELNFSLYSDHFITIRIHTFTKYLDQANTFL